MGDTYRDPVDHLRTTRPLAGESLIDVVRRRDGSVDEHPGGSPMNVAIGLGRLGRQVELLTWFGQDTRGAALREHLAESAVRVVEGSDGAASTSVACPLAGDAFTSPSMATLAPVCRCFTTAS